MKIKSRKALVLGATGQGGSLMSKYLLDKGHYVYGLVRKSATGNLENIKKILKNKRFKVIHGDLLDTISLQDTIKKIKPDEIYNFADQDHVRWSFQIPTYSFQVTGAAVINILEIIKNITPKTKYFQPLSSNMYAGSKKSKQNENEIFSPRSIYGLGKVSAYYACKMYKEVFDLNICGAIFYNHESEIRPEEYVTRKITKAVARIYYKKQKKISLGNIDSKIDWGYAEDYIEAAYKIMQLKDKSFYIIGSGKTHSIRDFLKIAFSHVSLDYKKHVIIDKSLFRPSGTVTLCADTKKAEKKFNFKPKTNFKALIKKMIDSDLKKEKINV